MTTEGASFSGFAIPTSNYFRLPNCWTDITASITSLAELKIVEYVARHTWGWQEYGIKKRICIDEFMYGRKRTDGTRIDKGTGLSKQSVIDGIKRAVAHEYLEEEIDRRDRGRVHKYYTLKISSIAQGDVKDLDLRCQGSRPQMSSNQTLDVKQPDTNCLQNGHRSEKETLERHLKERETVANPQPAGVSLSPSNSLLTSLTETETNFWTRFCAVSGADYQKLNQNAYKLVQFFAEMSLTTDAIQSLYDLAYRQIREFAKSKGVPEQDIKSPRLGNLKNAWPDWQAMSKEKEKSPEENHHHLPGTGEIRNVTRERLNGNGPPPLAYMPQPTQRRNRTRLEKIEFAVPSTPEDA
jgi:hypothetical protein